MSCEIREVCSLVLQKQKQNKKLGWGHIKLLLTTPAPQIRMLIQVAPLLLIQPPTNAFGKAVHFGPSV